MLAIKAVFILIIGFGIAAYMAAAITLIIYALGSVNSKKRRRIAAASGGLVMIWALIYTIASIIQNYT